jgi:hypothetical protein
MASTRAAAAIAIAVAALLPSAAPASAEVNYPWCVITSGRDDGVMSCGFVSYAQCMQTRVGTEMCVQNPRYQGPPTEQPQPGGLRKPVRPSP